MKNLLILLLTIFSTYVYSQCTIVVNSPEGDITIDLQIMGISAPEDCDYGYVFNPIIEYNVSTPVHLYTLQGFVGCKDGLSFFNLPNTGGEGTVKGANVFTLETNCATASPEALKCLEITIEIEGPGVPHQTIPVYCDDLLPIQLVSFDVNKVQDHVSLRWVTGGETPSIFHIERSKDGSIWEELGRMEGKGSFSKYSYNDYSFNQENNYYRLVNIDSDGHKDISEVRRIDMGTNSSVITVKGSKIILTFGSYTKASLYNIVGTEVSSFEGTAGSLSTNGMEPGIYFLVNENTGESTKLFIGF